MRVLVVEDEVAMARLIVDALAIQGAVANLIDNALRMEPDRGEIEVRVNGDGSVDVVDHGEGVALQHRDLVFEPFWRGDPTAPGTGLGLAIVREVARLHGGTVEVIPTLGGGATFRLRLYAPSSIRPS